MARKPFSLTLNFYHDKRNECFESAKTAFALRDSFCILGFFAAFDFSLVSVVYVMGLKQLLI